MRNVCKKVQIWSLLLLLMVFAAGLTVRGTTSEVQAATKKTGFQTIGGKTYYYNSNGKKHTGWLTLNGNKYYFDSKGVQQKGWLTLNGKKYYFTSKKGIMCTGWLENSKKQRRYFNKKTGVMQTGWLTLSGKKYHFNAKTGIMQTGFVKISGKTYYFDPKTKGAMNIYWLKLNGKTYYMNKNGVVQKGWLTTKSGKKYYFTTGKGIMTTGWLKNSKGQKRYFDPSTGIMKTKFAGIGGKTYYFFAGSGIMATGWLKNSKGEKRYFDESTGVMAVGKKTINGTSYTFGSDGVMVVNNSSGVTISQPSSARTIKNYLLGALQPVGQALYVWGGGWNDSTRKGVSPTWKQWYDKQSSSYDYNNYRDLSTANRAKGLDCSGFVGWAAYQVMQTKSGVGSGYTVVSGDVGSYYKSLGWGSILTQSSLSNSNWTLKAGDVGYNSGHTWIVIGQCADKSAVIVHSTPQAGCQISGTPTPSGNYSSQAITLAKKYMSRYKGYTKYDYHTSSGNYIRNGNYLRWNSKTLSDPDGYLNKTADQILADLFK